MKHPRLLVIGSTNTDMVVVSPALPTPGQTVLGGAFRMTPGGKGANQAVAAARAGGDVTFITALGDDTFGAENRERFAREGIHTRFVITKTGVPSGVALIMVDANGENMISVAPGANGKLTPDDIMAAKDIFPAVDTVIMQLEIPLDCVMTALRLAALAGARVILNPAPMPEGGLSDALLSAVDILTPNEGELFALAPGASSLDEAAAQVLARGPRTLVVTQGAQGATVFTRDGIRSFCAFPVTPVDTVGAGDCFTACLGVALTHGVQMPEAVRFAICAAGLSTTAHGAQSSMPTRTQIEQALVR